MLAAWFVQTVALDPLLQGLHSEGGGGGRNLASLASCTYGDAQRKESQSGAALEDHRLDTFTPLAAGAGPTACKHLLYARQ